MDDTTELDHCDCCGGVIPAEGSEAWEAENSEGGYCPGHLATRNGETTGVCGLFDPELDFRALGAKQ